MDFAGQAFVGLTTIGFINVLGFFYPQLNPKIKIATSAVFAFIMLFVPAEIGNIIFDRARIAIEIALASSGGYKIAQKIGGV